jgi:hypothetical protein
VTVKTAAEIMAMPAEPRQWGGWKLRKTTYELLYTPHPETAYVYPVDLERFTTSAAVLDMIMQVALKTWATDACLAGLVRAINDILTPQGTLCSSGVSKTVTVSEIKKLVKQTRS